MDAKLRQELDLIHARAELQYKISNIQYMVNSYKSCGNEKRAKELLLDGYELEVAYGAINGEIEMLRKEDKLAIGESAKPYISVLPLSYTADERYRGTYSVVDKPNGKDCCGFTVTCSCGFVICSHKPHDIYECMKNKYKNNEFIDCATPGCNFKVPKKDYPNGVGHRCDVKPVEIKQCKCGELKVVDHQCKQQEGGGGTSETNPNYPLRYADIKQCKCGAIGTDQCAVCAKFEKEKIERLKKEKHMLYHLGHYGQNTLTYASSITLKELQDFLNRLYREKCAELDMACEFKNR